jgi:hypothetical protein
VFYVYLLPPSWDANSALNLNTMVASYESPQGQTYFVIPTTAANLATYAGTKSALTIIPSPTAQPTEEQGAAVLYQIVVNNPGPASILAPFAFRYAYGVTPWAQQGNATTINNTLTAFGNLILTGAQGGISTSTLFKGTTMDGQQFAFWYGVDYFQIQAQQAMAAAVIQGSNSQPPLLYDQNGINSLLAVAENVASNAVSYGCASSVTVTAVPFATYTAANPTDYANGIYDGFSVELIGQSGFLKVIVNLTAVTFPT